MAIEKWTLIDVATQTAVDRWHYSKNGATLTKRRLTGGVSDGVDILEIDNGQLALTILLTRGMSIWQGKCGDLSLQWDSPVRGPVHPAFVPVTDGSGVGWLYGFDEWLVRCGLESNGSPQFNEQGALIDPLHGRIANLPASHVVVSFDDATGEIVVEGTVYESRLFAKKLELKVRYTTKVGAASFCCCDTVTNLSAKEGEIVLLYHINTGLPFLNQGGDVLVPFEEMSPRSEAAVANLGEWTQCNNEKSGLDEVVFFFDPATDAAGNTEVLLKNHAANQGISLAFNKKQLPYFVLWKSRQAEEDGYVVGIEPTVNFPNPTKFERQQGRTVKLAPNASRSFELKFDFLQSAVMVADAEKRIQSLHASAKGKIHPTPRADWVQ